MLRGTYEERVAQVAATAAKADVVYSDCDCAFFGNAFTDGATAEYYDDFSRAVVRYTWHRIMGTLYRGVHLDGRHIIHIHLPLLAWNSLTCCIECRRRRGWA